MASPTGKQRIKGLDTATFSRATGRECRRLGEELRLFFVHSWVVDGPETLGRGLRAALDRTNSRAAGG